MKVPRDGRLKMEADADEGEITFFAQQCDPLRPTTQCKQTSADASLAFHKSGAASRGCGRQTGNTLIVNTANKAERCSE